MTDAKRVIDFIQQAGKTYGGSVRYGVVATVVDGPNSRGESNVQAKACKRRAALKDEAEMAGLKFTCDGPRWIDSAGTWREPLAASYVYTFSRKGGSLK